MTTVQAFTSVGPMPMLCAHCDTWDATDMIVRNGLDLYLCRSCCVWETMDDTVPAPGVQGPCDDCHTDAAVQRFAHMDGRVFQLCAVCFTCADHEPDYLYCVCPIPQWDGVDVLCLHCRHEVRLEDDTDGEDEDSEYEDSEDEDVDSEAWGYPTIDR